MKLEDEARDSQLAYHGYMDRGLIWYAGMPDDGAGANGGFVFRVFDHDGLGNASEVIGGGGQVRTRHVTVTRPGA